MMSRALYLLLVLAVLGGCVSKRDYPDPEAVAEGEPMRHGIWFDSSKGPDLDAPKALEPNAVERGKYLYIKNCASCHGVKGAGDGTVAKLLHKKPANLKTLGNIFPHANFFLQIGDGKGVMPAWKDVLTKEQMHDLTQYLATLAK